MPSIPEHIVNIRTNLGEVNRLLEIHREITASAPGRRQKVQVLNRSAILLLVATWEAYVEDLAILACRFMVEKAESSDALPDLALVKTSRRLESDPNHNSIWKLSGDGWKNELLAQVEIETSRLNSPNAKNIDLLFADTLGLRNLSQNWYWSGAGRDITIGRLERLIELRGEIAHRVQASGSVTKAYVEDKVQLIMRLAAVTSNRVRTHIIDTMSENPWPRYRHRTAS